MYKTLGFLFNWPIFRRLLQFGPGRQWPPTETKILQAWCPSCHKAVSKHWSDAHTHIVSNYFILFIYFIRSTSKSRPNNIKGGKCPPVRTSVRPSTKSFFDLNEISYVGRGRWVMHDGMPYGRIQGQGQGHEPLKIWIPSIFKSAIYNGSWQMTTNS